jgi:hypothetical protein
MLVWAALPLEDAVIKQRVRVVLTGPDRRACHLRAIRYGLWRRLTVTHGHSGHSGLRRSLYRRRDHTNGKDGVAGSIPAWGSTGL